MDTYRLKGIFDESIFKIPKLYEFICKEVEIVIKKSASQLKNVTKINIKKAQEITSKYIPKNTNISEELISERRKEFEYNLINR